MAQPVRNSPEQTRGVAGTRGPQAKRAIQPKDPMSSAVPKTAGTTVEKLSDASTKYSRSLKSSRPRYRQFPVRQLMASKSHQTGTEITKSMAKSRGDRVSGELPVRRRTSASTTRMYPSHSGKNSTCVRGPVNNQFSNHATPSKRPPIAPCRALTLNAPHLPKSVSSLRAQHPAQGEARPTALDQPRRRGRDRWLVELVGVRTLWPCSHRRTTPVGR